jgi:ABC-type sugar transport system substrate-binding protein
MKRRTLLSMFLLITILALTVTACKPAAEVETAPAVEEAAEAAQEEAPAAEAEEAPAASDEVFTIGLASFQQGNDWNIQVAEGAKAAIEARGWEVVHTNAEADSDKQLTALEGFLSQGVDGVIIPGGTGPTLEPIIAQFKEAGIPVVAIDFTSANAVTNIYPDNYMTTEMLGVFAVNRMAAVPGKYAHLTVPDLGWKTVDIRDKVADLVFEIEGWESTGILDSGIADAVNQSMTAARSALLANPDLDLIYSSWGMPAVGAARAIIEADLQDQVFVVCTDADRIVLAEMDAEDSPIAAVIGQRPADMGAMAVETLEDAFAGADNLPTIKFAPFYFVTKQPELVPPGADVLSPREAWEALYPGAEFGEVN